MANSDEHLPHVTYVFGNGNDDDDDDDDDTANSAAVRSLPSASNAKEATVFVVGASLLSLLPLSSPSSWIIASTP
jgi:hypothetical protein